MEIDSTDLRASEPKAQAHIRADSGVSGGRYARARARFVDFLEAATRPFDGFGGAF